MSCAQAAARLFNTTQEARVMLEAVFEPIFFGLESDQHARWFAMARDDDFRRLRLAKKSRQIVLDFPIEELPSFRFCELCEP
jgi:hypothetical protein